MKSSWVFIILLLQNVNLFAQQPGDGGIKIMSVVVHNAFNYYHQPEQQINPTDTAFHVSYYILSNDDRRRVTGSYQPQALDTYKTQSDSTCPIIYVPLFITTAHGQKMQAPNQRVVMTYHRDTMVIDFMDIDAAKDSSEMINLLEFYPHSHFVFHRNIAAIHPERKLSETSQQLLDMDRIMRRGFYDSTYQFLSGLGVVEDVTNYKDVVLFKDGLYDTLNLKNYPVYPIKPAAIKQLNNTGSRQLNITITDPPIVTGNGLQYRLVFAYHFSSGHCVTEQDNTSTEERKALESLSAFTTHSLFINHTPFTGTIMMYYNAGWDTISARGATYNLITSEYKEGRLVNTHTTYDVGWLNGEHRVVRPV